MNLELTKEQMNITKGVAILFMVLLHLFCTKQYEGLFTPLIMVGETPLVYYFALFADCCVAIYCFASGYGLMFNYLKNDKVQYNKGNRKRILNLYINYWIILIIFVAILGTLLGRFDIFANYGMTFLLTVLAIQPAYNGAWWFVTTYIILVLLSRIINRVIIKFPVGIVLPVTFILYFIGYLQRMKTVLEFSNPILTWLVTQLGLLGTSLLPFVVGAIFAHRKVYSKIVVMSKKIGGGAQLNCICILIIVAMIIAHGFVESLFVAPFTGIVFIVVFNLMYKPKKLEVLLLYISKHSTNIWLTHMFFYMIYFKDYIYMMKYSVLIFIWLIFICIMCSYVVMWIQNMIVKRFRY